MNKLILSLLALLVPGITLHAQTTTFPPARGTDSVGAQSVFKKLEPTLWVLPAAAITYGALSLHSDGLEDLNEHVKWEVAQEHPHNKLHLDNYLQWSPAVAVYALNAFGVKGKHDFADRSLIYGMSTVIMAGTVFATKNLTHEWRPDHSDQLSFPSGHTATAFAAAEFMRKEYADQSIWYGVAGYAAAAATGYLRMYNNKHWLSDVVAGAGVGILSTDVAYWLYPTIKRMMGGKPQLAHSMALPYYSNGTVGLSFVHQF